MSKSKQKKLRRIKGTPFWIQRLANLDYGIFSKGTGLIRRFTFDPSTSALQMDKFKQEVGMPGKYYYLLDNHGFLTKAE